MLVHRVESLLASSAQSSDGGPSSGVEKKGEKEKKEKGAKDKEKKAKTEKKEKKEKKELNAVSDKGKIDKK